MRHSPGIEPIRRAGPLRRCNRFVLGGIALGAAVTIWLAAASGSTREATVVETYVPASGDEIVARVSPRDAAEVRARRSTAAVSANAPQELHIAIERARADVARYRQSSDPRHLGRAQATLAPWWMLADPPTSVLVLRATIRQSLHDFASARADLDRAIKRAPDDAQAHLTRAVVATVMADYATARESCAALAGLARRLVVETCTAQLDALGGDAGGAYVRLEAALAAWHSDGAIRGWALTQLAELAVMRGDLGAAELHARAALSLDPDDAYARDLLADVWLGSGRPQDASALLAGREHIDSHLLRRAIAEHRIEGDAAPELAAAMRERIRSAAIRGDEVHLREEARFALTVEDDPARAARLAQSNWAVQKELADARLLAEAAVAAGSPVAAMTVRAWATAVRVRDVQLDHWLARMETAR